MSYSFRKATIRDANFLTKVIIEAEKSGSNKIGLAEIFNLKERELIAYLIQIFEEGLDGCEFSINSYLIVEYKDKAVGAFGGWIEKENVDELPSSILKSNLIGFTFPQDSLIAFKQNQILLKDIQIVREAHAHQLEYSFIAYEHRGQGLTNQLIKNLLSYAIEQNPKLKKSQVQVFENNVPAINVYKRAGYKVMKRQVSTDEKLLDLLPWNVKLLMEKIINNG